MLSPRVCALGGPIPRIHVFYAGGSGWQCGGHAARTVLVPLQRDPGVHGRDGPRHRHSRGELGSAVRPTEQRKVPPGGQSSLPWCPEGNRPALRLRTAVTWHREAPGPISVAAQWCMFLHVHGGTLNAQMHSRICLHRKAAVTSVITDCFIVVFPLGNSCMTQQRTVLELTRGLGCLCGGIC